MQKNLKKKKYPTKKTAFRPSLLIASKAEEAQATHAHTCTLQTRADDTEKILDSGCGGGLRVE